MAVDSVANTRRVADAFDIDLDARSSGCADLDAADTE